MKLNNHFPARQFCVAALLSLMGTLPAHSQTAPDARLLIESAKAGQTVRLPAGTFAVAEIHVPSGVSVVGAGYQQTILDARGAANGLVVTGAKNTLTGFTIRGARETGLKIDGAQGVTLRAVRATGNLTGAVLNRANNARLENCLLDANRTGLSLTRCATSVAVNCTVANNTALALGVADAREVAVFNSILAGSPTGVYLSRDYGTLTLDHNLVSANVIGKWEGEAPRHIFESWARLIG